MPNGKTETTMPHPALINHVAQALAASAGWVSSLADMEAEFVIGYQRRAKAAIEAVDEWRCPPMSDETTRLVTPEMIDAGVEELCARQRATFYSCPSDADDDLVAAIYLAMEVARVKKK